MTRVTQKGAWNSENCSGRLDMCSANELMLTHIQYESCVTNVFELNFSEGHVEYFC